MADDLRRLLSYIVQHPVDQIDTMQAELNATAVQDVPAEIGKISKDNIEDAQTLAGYFEQGLKIANRGTLVVDDTTPDGNGIASVFARFLVATRLATSTSESLPGGHYRYTFAIDWPALRSLAQSAGIDLDAALATRG